MLQILLLGPNQLFVLVTALNRAQRLKTYATPLYGFCRVILYQVQIPL